MGGRSAGDSVGLAGAARAPPLGDQAADLVGLLWLVSVLAAYLAGVSGLTGWVPHLILSAALLLNLRWRAMRVNAGLDRTSTPIAAGGSVCRLIASPEGGWPLLLHDQDGRWLCSPGRSETWNGPAGLCASGGRASTSSST